MQTDWRFLKFFEWLEFWLWDVKRYSQSKLSSKYPIQKLESIIKEENNKEKIFLEPDKEFGILGVNNKEGVFDAYKEFGKNINQPYKKVEKHWIAYNPYRINVGSIGKREEWHENEYISPAYVVFSCVEDKVLPDFFFKTFRTNKFNQIINESTTGSVRQNLTFDILKKLRFPIPPLETQQILLDKYTQKLHQAEANLQEAVKLEKQIERYLLEELGIKFEEKPKEKAKGFFLIEYQEVERWNVEFLKNISSTINIKKGKYPTAKVRNLLTYLQYGLSLKASIEPKGFPLIRMNNIVKGQLIVNNLKYLDIPIKDVESTLLKKGDLLFNRTNSKELVGKTAVFDLEGDYTFASYCIRLRFDITKVNIEYVNYLLNSKIGRVQIDQVSRQVLGQANINSQELQEFIFPIPPLAVQEQIVESIQSMKSRIKFLKMEAESLKTNALADFEGEIFE